MGCTMGGTAAVCACCDFFVIALSIAILCVNTNDTNQNVGDLADEVFQTPFLIVAIVFSVAGMIGALCARSGSKLFLVITLLTAAAGCVFFAFLCFFSIACAVSYGSPDPGIITLWYAATPAARSSDSAAESLVRARLERRAPPSAPGRPNSGLAVALPAPRSLCSPDCPRPHRSFLAAVSGLHAWASLMLFFFSALACCGAEAMG